MRTEKSTTGLGPVGVKTKIDVDGLRHSMGALFGALAQTSGSVADLAGKTIGIAREVGIDNLIRLAREGDQEAMQLVGSLYIAMQKAAENEVQEAGELAATIAGKLEEAGYAIKSHGCGHDCDCKNKH